MPKSDIDVGGKLYDFLQQIIYTPEQASFRSEEDLHESAARLKDGLELLRQFRLEEKAFGEDLMSGKIDDARIPSRYNVLAAPLKSVHSMLKHLTWLMGEVASGDYRQRLNYANELSDAFNAMVAYLVELSLHDHLTGLLNVNGFDEKASALLSGSKPVDGYFFVSINVNDFRHFNALYGAEKGDALLVEVANFLRGICIAGELAARTHADSFMCLVRGQSAQAVARRFNLDEAHLCHRKCLRTFLFRHGIYPVQSGVQNVRQMRRWAVFADSSIQHASHQNYAIFDAMMAKQYDLESNLLAHFERAIKNHEFKILYQPQVDTLTGKVAACEALVRWELPDGSMMLPGAFIELFEVNGLITMLDFYVLEKVCMILQDRKRKKLPCIPVAVNFSRMHLLDADFVQQMCAVLQRYQVEPRWIEVEITERAFFENQVAMRAMIDELHHYGFQIAMDDFGAGFSSLSFLRIIPLDVIKIDKMFFDDFEVDQRGRLLLQDILSRAHHLDLRVVAEGVETAAQVAFLKKHACDLIQGYYFYRPLRQECFQGVLEELFSCGESF